MVPTEKIRCGQFGYDRQKTIIIGIKFIWGRVRVDRKLYNFAQQRQSPLVSFSKLYRDSKQNMREFEVLFVEIR